MRKGALVTVLGAFLILGWSANARAHRRSVDASTPSSSATWPGVKSSAGIACPGVDTRLIARAVRSQLSRPIPPLEGISRPFVGIRVFSPPYTILPAFDVARSQGRCQLILPWDTGRVHGLAPLLRIVRLTGGL